jgi:hypothetical protein
MAPLVNRLANVLDPRRGSELGSCLGCGRPVREDDDYVRAPRGGVSHSECATYRMRREGARPRRTPRRPGARTLTGD